MKFQIDRGINGTIYEYNLGIGQIWQCVSPTQITAQNKAHSEGLKAWTILIHIGALKSGNRYNLEEPAMPKRKTYTYTQAQLPNNPTT